MYDTGEATRGHHKLGALGEIQSRYVDSGPRDDGSAESSWEGGAPRDY